MVWRCPAVSKVDYEWWNRIHHVGLPSPSSPWITANFNQ